MVDFSVAHAFVLALLVRLPTANTTIPARMPRITITMSNSTRVKPRCSRFLSSSVDRVLFHTGMRPFDAVQPPARSSFKTAVLGLVCMGPKTHTGPDAGSGGLLRRGRVEQLGGVEDPVHRRDQGDRDEPDDQSHEDDDCGLEQRREALQLVLQPPAVILGGV